MRPAGLEAPACWRRRSVFSLVSVAEDRRFELLRGCPNTLSNNAGQRPPPSANCANTIRVTTGERWRTGVNETQTETSSLQLDAGAGGSFGSGGGIEGCP